MALVELHSGLSDGVVLSTGRKVTANCTILGLQAFGSLYLCGGYDQRIYEGINLDDGEFTLEERREIAYHMIRRWVQWADDDTDTQGTGGIQGLD